MRFDHISVEHGMSNFTPFHIIQDAYGFLWIGTEDGLNRYDGYAFKIYKHIPQDSTSIAGNTITGMAVDRNATLWLTTGHILMKYVQGSDSFTRISLKDSVVPSNFVMTAGVILSDDQDDLLWIATNYGLKLFNTISGHMQTFRLLPADSSAFWSNVITSLADDHSGGLWLGSNNGIHRFDKASGTFRSYFPNRRYPNKGLSRDNITAVTVDSSGTVWVGTMGGLLRYDSRLDDFVPVRHSLKGRPYYIGDTFIVTLYVDANGDLWIGTFHEGLLKHDRRTDRFTQYVSDPKDPRTLLTNRVICLYQDRSGVLWAGNYRAGLNKYNRRNDQFNHYVVDSDVYAVLEDSFGDVIFPTKTGHEVRY